MQTTYQYSAPVETVRVTKENINEVAEWCGGSIVTKGDKTAVLVPTSKNAKISLAFPTMFVTKRIVSTSRKGFVVTFAVFRKEYFAKNYFQDPTMALDKTWSVFNAEDPVVELVEPEVETQDQDGDVLSAFNPGVVKPGVVVKPGAWLNK